MGSSTSKAARTAANTSRKYPSPNNVSSRTRNAPPEPPRPAAALEPTTAVPPQSHTRSTKDEAIPRDSAFHDLTHAARLTQLGAVQPPGFQASASAPTQSVFPTRARNPAVTLLQARARIAQAAEAEFEGLGRKGAHGRQFVDVGTLRQLLRMRDEQGEEEGIIEARLGLRAGVVRKLGPKGVVGVVD